MDLIYWLLLKHIPKVGDKTFYNALQYFEEPKNVFNASEKQLVASGVFKQDSIEAILNVDKNFITADIITDMEWQKQDGCHIITWANNNYPQQLLEIADPPPILWVRGDVSLLNKQQLAIVGSRNPTTGGAKITEEFAKSLAGEIIITSGMASGIDSYAHIGALSSGNPTIAVCGTGLDRVYPAKNSNLAKQIATSGALVSELPIGTRPLGSNFPRRNRIITGMSVGVLVVEALMKSGSMVSAKSSLEQGREVFAIPSSIKNPLSEGPHSLIKEGAILVDTPDDILDYFNLKTAIKDEEKLEKIDNILLPYLNYDGVSIDELVIKSGLDIAIITSNLLELEIANIIEKVNNNYKLL